MAERAGQTGSPPADAHAEIYELHCRGEFARLNCKQDRILRKIDVLDETIRGDGRDSPGILIRVDRLEASETRAAKRREWTFRAAVAAVLGWATWAGKAAWEFLARS